MRALECGALPAKSWAADGSGRRARAPAPRELARHARRARRASIPERAWQALQAKHERIAAAEARCEAEGAEDAELLVVAFGSLARFARHAVRELRAEGVRVGFFRPITLWPFPSEALARGGGGRAPRRGARAERRTDDRRREAGLARQRAGRRHRRHLDGSLGLRHRRRCSTRRTSAAASRDALPDERGARHDAHRRDLPAQPRSSSRPTTTSARAAASRSRCG